MFQVFGNGGVKLYESPVCKGGASPVSIDIPVAGQDSLYLVTTDGGDGNANDHADWAGPKLILSTGPVGVSGRELAGSAVSVTVRGDALLVERSTEVVDEVRIVASNGRVLLRRPVSGLRSDVSIASVPRGVYVVEIGSGTTFASKMIVRN